MKRSVLWLGLAIVALASDMVLASGAVRVLPQQVEGGTAFSVVITVDPPAGTTAVGIEDRPPAGWDVIANISNGGTCDAANHKVKWGPFFAPSIPAQVSYDITPPPDASGMACFAGTVSFDGFNEPIAGDSCVEVLVVPGDLDSDGDVDVDDFAVFLACLAGPEVSTPPSGCDPTDFAQADLDGDLDVDLTDFAALQQVFTGPQE